MQLNAHMLPAERLVLRLRPRRKKVWVLDTIFGTFSSCSRVKSVHGGCWLSLPQWFDAGGALD
jgi:hypothetical protein